MACTASHLMVTKRDKELRLEGCCKKDRAPEVAGIAQKVEWESLCDATLDEGPYPVPPHVRHD